MTALAIVAAIALATALAAVPGDVDPDAESVGRWQQFRAGAARATDRVVRLMEGGDS